MASVLGQLLMDNGGALPKAGSQTGSYDGFGQLNFENAKHLQRSMPNYLHTNIGGSSTMVLHEYGPTKSMMLGAKQVFHYHYTNFHQLDQVQDQGLPPRNLNVNQGKLRDEMQVQVQTQNKQRITAFQDVDEGEQ